MVESNVKEIKENKILKLIGNIGFAVFMIIMSILIFITAQSRLTGMEPTLLGHRIYIVDSGSMAPTLPVDSMIIVKEVLPNEIKKGDIVTYYGSSGATRITHRIVEVKKDGQEFITRGDANNTEDPSVLKGNRLIGKLAFSIPYIGKVFRMLNGKLGITFLIILGSLWIIVPLIVKNLNKFET